MFVKKSVYVVMVSEILKITFKLKFDLIDYVFRLNNQFNIS